MRDLIQPDGGNATQSHDVSDSDDIVWGARAIGREVNRSPRQAYHLLEKGSDSGSQDRRQMGVLEKGVARRGRADGRSVFDHDQFCDELGHRFG